MKLLDTVILVAAMNPADKHHKIGIARLRDLRSEKGIFVPSSTLTEFDLVMRNRGYEEHEVSETWRALVPFIGGKVLATTPSAHLLAAEVRRSGLTYFDSLITALAKELGASVLTNDAEISKQVGTEW